jgi:hypothetical protein
MRLATIPASLFALYLAGCGNIGGTVPRQSTNLDVRASLGAPTDIRFDRNGDELWEYARGPAGFETHLVRMGSDGKVKEVTQVLTQERLMSVVTGTMTKQDVRHLLGRPSDPSFTGSGEVWSWRFKLGGVQPGYLVVSFNPDNTVRERTVITDGSSGERSREK